MHRVCIVLLILVALVDARLKTCVWNQNVQKMRAMDYLRLSEHGECQYLQESYTATNVETTYFLFRSLSLIKKTHQSDSYLFICKNTSLSQPCKIFKRKQLFTPNFADQEQHSLGMNSTLQPLQYPLFHLNFTYNMNEISEKPKYVSSCVAISFQIQKTIQLYIIKSSLYILVFILFTVKYKPKDVCRRQRCMFYFWTLFQIFHICFTHISLKYLPLKLTTDPFTPLFMIIIFIIALFYIIKHFLSFLHQSQILSYVGDNILHRIQTLNREVQEYNFNLLRQANGEDGQHGENGENATQRRKIKMETILKYLANLKRKHQIRMLMFIRQNKHVWILMLIFTFYLQLMCINALYDPYFLIAIMMKAILSLFHTYVLVKRERYDQQYNQQHEQFRTEEQTYKHQSVVGNVQQNQQYILKINKNIQKLENKWDGIYYLILPLFCLYLLPIISENDWKLPKFWFQFCYIFTLYLLINKIYFFISPQTENDKKNPKKNVYSENLAQSSVNQILTQSENIANNSCCICLQNFTDPLTTQIQNSLNTKIITQCKHQFHFQCLSEWVSKKMICPVDRNKLSIVGILRVKIEVLQKIIEIQKNNQIVEKQ